MALATQCPHCHTTFRVAADQLKLRGGIVRCGACHEIFDGNASLIDLDAPPRPPVELPPPTPTAADDAPVYALDFGSALNRHGILPQAVEPQPEPEPEQPEEAVDFSDLLSVGPSFLRRQEPVAPLNEGAMDPGLRRDDGLEGEGEVEAVETPAVEAVVPEDSPEPESQDPSPLGRQEPITPPSGDAMDPGLRQDDGIEVAEEVEVPEPPATEVAAPEQPQEPETAEPSPLGRQEPIAPQSSGAMDPGLRQDDGLEAEGEVEAVEAPVAEVDTTAPPVAEPPVESEILDSTLLPAQAPVAADLDDPPTIMSSDEQRILQAPPVDIEHGPLPLLRQAAPADDPLPEPEPAPAPKPRPSKARGAKRSATPRPTPVELPPAPVVVPEPEPEPDEPVFVRQAREQERSGHRRRVALVAGSLALTALLLVQGVTTFRNVLVARFPAMGMTMARACDVLGCRLELPAQIEALGIETGELHPLNANTNTFSLVTLLRNQSALTQSWPYIELELLDATDKPLVRRVFTPAEYLPAGTQPAKGFGARTEQPVRLFFELKQVKAQGYHIAVFYP